MKDIEIVEICDRCGDNLTLMESIRHPEGELWLVKRCACGEYPVTEVVRLYNDEVSNFMNFLDS
jgi:hypothetical protein